MNTPSPWPTQVHVVTPVCSSVLLRKCPNVKSTKEARERDITEALHRHDKTVNQKGATLPDSQRVYRVKVAMAFLKAGVPFEKVDCFRELLEENAY